MLEQQTQPVFNEDDHYGSHPGIGGMPSTIMNLEAQDWPSRLAKAGEELEQVCGSATILPLSLLRHDRTWACSAGSLITQYKSVSGFW